MAVVNVEFRASANFSELYSQINAANVAVQNLDRSFTSLQRGKIDDIVGDMNKALAASGQYTVQTMKMKNAAEEFGKALDRQKLSLNEYKRAWTDYKRTGEGAIRDLARQQVMLQRSVAVSRGRDSAGNPLIDLITPTGLDNSLGTKAAVARKEMQILNKVLNDGAQSLINWGKNTQWAGRQLTVGLTVPLTILGGVAAKLALDLDKEMTRIVKVYGNSLDQIMSPAKINQLKQDLTELSKVMASTYGQTAQQTLQLAGDIAATGQTGKDLTESVIQTTRLATLGEVDRAEAMKATLAIQTAFKTNTEDLADSINFLNAVENQTSTTLQDLVEAIPKAGPVVEGLGGSVKDLALMMVAMREGGIPAAEAANAIKSGLASMINPTKQAREMLMGFNIDIDKIQKNANGELIPMLTQFKAGLDDLDDFSRSQVIEQMFGKYQFARMTALFNNLGASSSQTLQVMELMGASAQELGTIAQRELDSINNSISGQWTRSLELLKANLASVGDVFLEIGIKAMNALNWIFEKFDSAPDWMKNLIAGAGALVAVIGPIIMTTGVLGNLLGYVVKGIAAFKVFGQSGVKNFEMLTKEEQAAKLSADLLKQSFFDQKTAAQLLTGELEKLVAALAAVEVAQAKATGATNVAASQQASAAASQAKAAVVQSGLPRLIPTRSLNASGKEVNEFSGTGFEFSHLMPTAGKTYATTLPGQKGSSVEGVGTSRLLAGSSIVTDESAKMFQQKMNKQMKVLTIGFLDEATANIDDVRKQMLVDLAKTGPAGNQEALATAQRTMSAAGRAQLLPTVQEFKRTNVMYAARVKALADLGPEELKRFTAVVNSEVARTKSRYLGLEAAWKSKAGQAIEQNAIAIGKTIEAEVDAVIRVEKDIEKRAAEIIRVVDTVEAQARARLKATQATLGAAGKGLSFADGTNTNRRGVEGDIATLSNNLTRDQEGQNPGRYAGSEAGQRAEAARRARMELIAIQRTGTAEQIAAKRAEVRQLIALQLEQKAAVGAIKKAEVVEQINLEAAAGGRGMSRGKKAAMIGGSMLGAGIMTAGMSGGGMLGDAGGVLGGAMMGASMGMMVPVPGAPVAGAIIGGLVTGIPMVIGKVNEFNAAMKSMGNAGEVASDMLGAKFKTLAEVQLVNLIEQTDVAKEKFMELKTAFEQAGEGTTDKAFIDLLRDSEIGDVKGLVMDKVAALIQAEVKPEDIKTFVAAALAAAGREGDAPQILAEIARQNLTDKSGALLAQLESGTSLRGAAGRDSWRTGKKILADTPDEASRLTELFTNTAASSGQDIEGFKQTLADIDGKLFDIQDVIPNVKDKWQEFAKNIQSNGGNTKEMLQLIALEASGLQVDFDALSKNPYEITLLFNSYQARMETSNEFMKGVDAAADKAKAAARVGVPTVETQEAFDKRKEAMAKAQQERIKSVEAHYDKLIEAEKKKEAELNKIQEAEKRRLDREKAMRDSQVAYNEAIASGNFGQAALIKNNMASQQSAWALEDKQREQDEAAKTRLEELEAAKEAAVAAEQKRLDAINEMQKSSLSKTESASKKAADAQVENQKWAQAEIKKLVESLGGDVIAAAEVLSSPEYRKKFSDRGLDVGTYIKAGITSVLPGLPQSVIKSVTDGLPDAPWDQLGKAIQGKIMGGPGGNRLFAQAIRALNAWKPTQPETRAAGSTGFSSQPNAEDRFSGGGYIAGRGHGTSDDIDAKLSNGEYVVRNSAVSFYGKSMMDAINTRKFATGGYVESVAGGTMSNIFAGAAMAAIRNAGNTVVGSSPSDPGAGSIAGGGSGSVTGTGLGAKIAAMGMQYLGVPYSYTGDSPAEGWGCAPFVHYVYKQAGYTIPGGYVSNNQYNAIRNHPDRGSVSAGDLMFFKYANGLNTGNPINHVGMYIGGGQMVHAANPSRGTIVSGVDWANYKGAARPVNYDTGLKNYAKGGLVANVMPGEFMINDGSVKKYGLGFMNAINNQTYHEGGLVTANGPQRGLASGGGNQYNFTIHGDGASPAEIADEVMARLKTKEKRKGSGR